MSDIDFKYLVSGCLEWEFEGEASFEGLEKYADWYGNDLIDAYLDDHNLNYEDFYFDDHCPDIIEYIIKSYLRSVNEDPANYF